MEALADIEAEQRAPSHEELQSMAGYIGWGSFGQDLFLGTFERQPVRKGWDAEAAWLRQHLGKEQWESANASIINAHYTDPPTVKAMWDMVRAMGFKGGRVLEPSMGIGNFFGLMPRDIMGASTLTGIELDTVTGRMAKLLYPDAGIHIKGYQESSTPDNFYDLVIGNWPFSAISPADRRYDRLSPTLHDYFFLKGLDQTRPGGLVVGITSAGTMDKSGRATRLELARKGELIASFRLPSGAFEKYAGTSVVTDIIVLRKRETVADNPSLEPWINSSLMDTPAGEGMSPTRKAERMIRVNQHYQDNPTAVLGTLDYGHGTTSGQAGMIVHRPDDLMRRLQQLPSLVPEDGYNPVIRGTEPRFLANNTTDRNGTIVVKPDGKLYQVKGDQMLDMADTHANLLTGTAKARGTRLAQVSSLADMRRGYGALIDAERDGKPETEQLRQALAKQFNDFRGQHGRIGDSAGLKLMERAEDPSYALVRALERPDGTPSRILSQSTVRSKRRLDNPSVTDAYVLARNEQSILNMDRVAELAKVPREVAAQQLLDIGAVLRTPGGGYEPADQHLSGNVRKKLAEAQQALALGEPMQNTVDRLTAAIPPTVPYFTIEAKLGAPWVGDAAYKAFVGELLSLAPGDTAGINVQFVGNRWKVEIEPRLRNKPEAGLWGDDAFRFDNFIGKAMGNETLRVMDPADRDGGPYFNAAASERANAKAQALREKFTDWAWADPERKVAFEHAYNQTMNAIAKPQFDGSFMDMSGMALHRGDDAFSLRRHQVNAIWRGVVQGRGLFAHEVGTGKTYTMGGIAVEGRRYGVFRKPLLFAHNANSATVAREINEMYPGAKIHYVNNLQPENIATEMHRIANEDWDLVVMPHSLIDRMSLTRETLMELAAEDIANLESEAIDAALSDGYPITPEMMDDKKAMSKVRSPTAKELVKARKAILARIEKDANRSSREGAVTFEQLGVDAIMVDEAHIFKKPPYVATRMRVKGLNTATSNRSIGLGFLTSYVKQKNNGRNVYLFTGTPITNTLNEIFNQSRYFMDDRLEQAGIKQWDAWFNTFAAAEPDVELTAGGHFENVTRLASFQNTDELVRLMSEFTDVVQAKDMPEFIDRATPDGKTLKSPDLTDEDREFLTNGRTPNPPGRPYKRIITDVGEMSPAQRVVLTDVQDRIAQFKALSGKERYEAMMTGSPLSPIITDQDGPKASLDVRNVDPDAPDDEGSKVNRAVRNMLRIYQEPGAAQMVFMETGYNAGVSQAGRAEKFILVRDLVNKLVAGGIPRTEIAVVAGGVTPEQKKDIADRMNDGRLRVAIGQTETLGTGVNAQRQLRAIHHLDAPWRPGDLTQRDGRGERQGNEWNTMLQYRYITEGIDGRRWQVLTSKAGFIGKFINAFNDTSGKRLGSMEVDADAVADNEDFSQTLSAAAGDPRIMLRAKYKADVTRLERRERLHTIGLADALDQVRRSEREQRLQLGDADWGNAWNAASKRAADQAAAAGDTKRWYEVPVTPQEAEEAGARFDAAAAAIMAEIPGLTVPPADQEGKVKIYNDRVARTTAHAEQMTRTAAAARASNGTWYETGDMLQARMDAKVKTLERAAIGTLGGNVPIVRLATINGFEIVSKWPPGNSDPLYWIADQPDGHQVARIDAPTMPRITGRMNVLLDGVEAATFRAKQMGKSIEALRKSATMDFPQREALQNKRMQLAKLEDDLQANPTPPPGWLRHGAPMDSTIYVNGEPREVRGHSMSDDYYLGTDQGDVPYLSAKDENGQRMFDVHPPPPKMEVPEWVKPIAETLKGQVFWHEGNLAVVRATEYGETVYLGLKEGIPDDKQGFNIYGMRGTDAVTVKDQDAMTAGVKETEDRTRNRIALQPVTAFQPTRGLEYSTDDPAGRQGTQFSPKITGAGRESQPYTAAEKQAYANVGRITEAVPWRERLAGYTNDLGRRAIANVFDQYIGVKADDPAGYMALRNANSSAGATLRFINDGTLKFKGSTYAMDDRNGGVQNHLVKPLQGEENRFIWWVAANRAERLSAEDRENLWSAADIDTLKGTNQGTVPFDYTLPNGTVTRSREAIYLDSLRKLDGFNRNTMDLAVQAGLISDQSASVFLSNPFYVPFYRQPETEGRFSGASISAGFVKQSAFKRLTGGAEKLNHDLWENAIGNWAHMIDASLRNRAAAAVLDVAVTNGAAVELSQRDISYASKKDKESHVWIMNNGQRQLFQVTDRLLFTAISALDFKGYDFPGMRALKQYKALLTRGVTASPLFMARVFIKDAMQAAAVAPASANLFNNVLQGMKMGDFSGQLQNLARALAGREAKPLRISDEAADAMAGGSTMHLGSATDTGHSKVALDTMLDTPGKWAKFWGYVSNVAHQAKELSAQAEDVQRLALYRKLTREGMAHDEAAFNARDIEDFTLHGSGRIVRFLAQTVPFLNAMLQGLYKVGRAGKATPGRLAIVLGVTTLAILALDALYADDEDNKKRSENDRNSNFWFKIGGVQFRIPMGFEIAALARVLANGAEAMAGASQMTGRRFLQNAGSIALTQLFMDPVPQGVSPLIQLYANKNGSGGKIVSDAMAKLQSQEQYNQNTSLASRAVSAFGSAATRAVAGPQAQFLAPVQLDYLVEAYLGWAGSSAMTVADIAARWADQGQAAARGVKPIEPVRPSRDMFAYVTGGMIATETTSASRYVDMLYQQAGAVERAYATYHDLLARQQPEAAKEFFDANKALIARQPLIQKVTSEEALFNKQIRRVENSTMLTADQKHDQVMKYEAQRNKAAENIFGRRQESQ